MRAKMVGVLLLFLVLLGGCAASRYGSAERYLKRREYDKALRAYLMLLEPHVREGKRYIYYDKEAVTGVGIVYWYMKRYETAAKVFQAVVAKDCNFGKALFYLGMSLEGLGREDEAIKTYRRYYRTASYDPYRQAMRGRLDWLVRWKVSLEIEQALQNEAQLQVAGFPEMSVAVLYFLNLSEDSQWEPLQKGLAEMMITDLSQIEELKVIERLRLNKLMEELRLGASGIVDDETAPRVGKLLGSRTLVKGSYMVMSDLKMTLDAGIYKIDKPYFTETSNFEGNLSRLFRMEKELVLRIVDYFGIVLTPQQRERILKIPTENMMAFMSYCQGLDALDQGDFKRAEGHFRNAIRLDRDFTMAQDLLISANIWEATHSRNLVRVNYDLARAIQTTPSGKPEIVRPPPALLSTWNRLQWMGMQQNAGFLPGNDTREAVQEAQFRGVGVVPELLPEPPNPPGQ